MKAIIVAAGKGSRISGAINGVPKSTLLYKGIPIIRGSVELLQDFCVSVSVCTGYKYQKIEEALSGLNVKYYYNPFYDVTNNIASLWFAREQFTDDMLVISADVIFDKYLIDKILSYPVDYSLAVDKSRVAEGDYFLYLEKDGSILEYGKDLPAEKRSCENVGLSKISKQGATRFKNTLCQLVEQGKYNMYYENVFFEMMKDGQKVYGMDVSGCQWMEIDYYEDYCRALKQADRKDIINGTGNRKISSDM